jgi:hypothetical protein
MIRAWRKRIGCLPSLSLTRATSQRHGPRVRAVGIIEPDVLSVDVVERGDSESGDVGLAEMVPQREGCFDGVPDAARSALDDGPSPVRGVEGDVGEGIGGMGDDSRCAGGVRGLCGVCVVP